MTILEKFIEGITNQDLAFLESLLHEDMLFVQETTTDFVLLSNSQSGTSQ